jgi:hypothetical protein
MEVDMKKTIRLTVLLLAILAVLLLTSCAVHVPIITGNTFSDVDGIGICIDSIGGTQSDPVLAVRWYNRTPYEVTFGRAYRIECKDGDEWQSVQNKDMAVPEIAQVLLPGEECVVEYSTDAFDIGREGLYRIRVDFTLQRGALAESGIAYAEFKIKGQFAIFSHNITVDQATAQRLTEMPATSYKEGERVTLRLRRADGAGYTLVVNGKAAIRGEDTDEYFEYYFFMPGENVHVTLTMHDAYDEAGREEAEMIDTYLSVHTACTDASVAFYYGRFIDSGTATAVGIIECGCGADSAVTEEWIGGHLFVYPTANTALAFANGCVYKLLEAYMLGYVSDGDLEYIAARHMQGYGYLYDGDM